MPEERAKSEQEKGFTVRDRRFSAQREEEKDTRAAQGKAERKPEEPTKEGRPMEETELPEITFANFIFSISTSALIQLGEIEDPVSQQRVKNLPLAKQTIDLIGMLKEKTKGNLTPDEERLIDNVLFDLRMKYVRAIG